MQNCPIEPTTIQPPLWPHRRCELPQMSILTVLREPAVATEIVWRDHPNACCLCSGKHHHHGDVNASHLADLVETGDERAAEYLRTIVMIGVAQMAARCRR